MALSSTLNSLPLFPAMLTSASYNTENQLGFNTIDGYCISQEEGEQALRSGVAMLVGGLLVGLVVSFE